MPPPVVSDLLRACPALKVLVTSRARLHLQIEREFRVHPLELPDLVTQSTIDELSRIPAIQLFLLRVQALQPDFALTPDKRGRDRGDLPAARWPAAGDRVGRRLDSAARTGRGAVAPGPAAPVAHRGRARSARAIANDARRHRLEL